MTDRRGANDIFLKRPEYFFRMALAVAIISVSVPAIAAGTPSASDLRAMLGISETMRVEYRDYDNEVLGEHEFFGRVFAGRAFTSTKNDAGDTVILTLSDPGSENSTGASPVPSIEIGDPFPLARLRALQTYPDNPEPPDAGPILVNFYFAECSPCIQEVPQLNAFRESRPGFDVLAVTFDSREEAEQFRATYTLSWPVVAEARDFIEDAGITVFPTLLLVDPDSRVLAIKTGGAVSVSSDGLKHFSIGDWVEEHLD